MLARAVVLLLCVGAAGATTEAVAAVDEEVITIRDDPDYEIPVRDHTASKTTTKNIKKPQPKTTTDYQKLFRRIASQVSSFGTFEDGNKVTILNEDLLKEAEKFRTMVSRAMYTTSRTVKTPQELAVEESIAAAKAGIQQQVENHRTLMKSTLTLIDHKSVKRSKKKKKKDGLRGYVVMRLRAKAMAKKLSSLDNINEMLEIQKVRKKWYTGLEKGELVQLAMMAVIPYAGLMLLRLLLVLCPGIAPALHPLLDEFLEAALSFVSPIVASHTAITSSGQYFFEQKHVISITLIAFVAAALLKAVFTFLARVASDPSAFIKSRAAAKKKAKSTKGKK